MNFEPGISAVVGPNGSGKSNVSEAVLWVLGEMNPRNLRVQAMEELIFSGSSARQAVGVAEVDLILDNSDHTLPIEFDEVALTRRMYRSGESEYFINGALCRRMDILDILHDSGIGQGAHSIISQGKLTTVLESRPEDRRALIEEAAGILKHKKRKEKATRKLAAMDASLDRVHDIIKVLDSQLRPLERQAARAQKHADLAAELKALDLSLAVDDLRSLQGTWRGVEKREKEIEAEAELAHFRLNEREAELSKRQVALEEKGLFAGDLNEQRIRCQSIMQRLDSGMLVLEEKGKNMISRLSDLRATIHNSETRLKSATEEYDRAALEISESDGRLQALYTSFNELSRESENIFKEKNKAEQEYSTLAASLRNREHALDSTRNNLAKTHDSLESLDLEEGLLRDRYEQIDTEFSGTQSLLAERRSKLDTLESQLGKAKSESALAKSDIDKRVRLLDDRKRKLDEQRETLSSIRAEIKALEEIDKAFETASPALAWILAHSYEFKGIVGPISDVFKAPVELERLIERLLGADLFGLFVQNARSAAHIANRLIDEEESEGEIALMPLEASSPFISIPAKYGTRLIDSLEYPSEYQGAAEALLGDVYLAESVNEALKFHSRDISGARFVTKDGAVVWPNGKVTLGVQVHDVDGVLARKRKLDGLRDELESALALLSDAEMAVSEAEQTLTVAQQDDFEIAQTRAKLQGDSDSAREEVSRLEKTMTDMVYKREDIERKLKDVEGRRTAATPLAGEFAQRIEVLEKEIDEFDQKVELSSKALLTHTEKKNEISEKLSRCKIEMETSKGSASYQKSRFETLEREIVNLKRTLDVSRETESSLDVIRLRVDPLYKLYEELHAGASRWAEKLRDQVQLEQTDSTNLRKVINEASKACESAREDLAEINERLTAVRVDKAKLESEVEHAIRRIVDENETTLELALETPSPEDRRVAEDQANRLRNRIAGLGAVNHIAMEEYESLKNRRDYMTGQIDDLEAARKALSKIAAALDRKMRNQFLETFEVVNKNFHEIFGILFPGGNGSLVLTEGETPESNGVEVNAQPRGKKITKLSLMSGGEKSLAALALLFAVYRTRSVPFYILDEAEAALDDTNLRRLCEYLGRMRNTTQLILVTHQRRTMEMADVLYGVSMQAAGVSKLVSQKLDQALRSAQDEDNTEAGLNMPASVEG